MFPKFLELFLTPKKTPPKVKNLKMGLNRIFLGHPVDYVEKIIISEESSKASQKDSKSTTLELPQCLLTRRTSKGFRSKSQLSKAAETVGTAPIKVIMNCH